MDWDKLRIFYTVANDKSFTRAGETLNLSQSAVSRQVSMLEDNLQVPLFHRHARGLLLTEQGDILYRTVTDVYSKLAATQNALMDSRERPKGPLKVTTPAAFGTNWLTPHMREFKELYPDITVNLIVADRELDIAMREADCAIRMMPAKQPDLIQRQLTTLHNSLYASHDYLHQHGMPTATSQLAQHKLIGYSEDERPPFADVNWLLSIVDKGQDKHSPAFKINSLYGMLKAMQSGVGIAALPDYMVQGMSGVSKVLPDLKGPVTEAYFLYPTELRNSKRINVFRDFLLRKVAETSF